MKTITSLISCFCFTFLLFSCKKAETEKPETITCGCGKQSPLTELKWINKVLSDSFYFANGSNLQVYAGARFYCCTYNNENVFYLRNPASSLGISADVVFNCQGTIFLDLQRDNNLQVFLLNKMNEQLLWSK